MFITKILIKCPKSIKMNIETKAKHILSISPKEMENCSVTLFNKICRVCFSCNEITSIFEQMYEHINLSEILEICFAIQIKQSDGLPQNICKWCISELIRIYTFKLHYQQSDAILRAALNMQNSNVIQDDVKELKEETDVGDALLNNSENISRNIQDIDNNVFKPDIKPNLNCIKNDIKEELNFEICIKQNNLQIIPTKCKILKSKNKTYSCKYCNISFDSRLKLIEHKKVAKHPRPRNHICQICNKAFSANNRLQMHIRSHTKEKPFHCEICPKKFSVKNNLKRHNMIHTGERPFTCDECGKGFIQLVELTQHKRVHTGEKSPRKKYKKFNYKFECNTCHRLLSSKKILKQHLLNHQQPRGPREKQYLCNHCGNRFTTLVSLKVHINGHTGFKPYHCSVCSKKFSQRTGLKSHMFIHTGEKPYVCKVCLRAFTQHTHLTYHMKTHTGERRYACSFCDRAFALKGNFTVHMRMHTGETPYSCSICGRGFYNSSNMKKHRRRHQEVKKKNE